MERDHILRSLVIFAVLLIFSATFALFYSRDFGLFAVAAIPLLVFYIAICICLVVWAALEKRSESKRFVLILLLAAVLAPVASFFAQDALHDRLKFALWFPKNQAMVQKWENKDGIVANWDSWGMAGSENDSYLVSNPSDKISNLNAATKWARGRYNDCPVVAVERMRRGLFLLTTYNCPLE